MMVLLSDIDERYDLVQTLKGNYLQIHIAYTSSRQHLQHVEEGLKCRDLRSCWLNRYSSARKITFK